MAELNGSTKLTDSLDIESGAEKTMSVSQLASSSDIKLDDDQTTLHDSLQQLVTTLELDSSDAESDVEKMLNDALLQLATRMMQSADEADAVLSHIADLLPLSAESLQLLINLDESLSRPGADPIRQAIENAQVLSQESDILYERYKLPVEDFSSKRDNVEYRRFLSAIMNEDLTKMRQFEEACVKIDKEVNKRALLRGIIQFSHFPDGPPMFHNVLGG